MIVDLSLSHYFSAYVKSQTLGADGMHTQGVVLGEIVKANIPVRNGVVHLIHRPLVIVDTTVVQFLEVRKCLRISNQSVHRRFLSTETSRAV